MICPICGCNYKSRVHLDYCESRRRPERFPPKTPINLIHKNFKVTMLRVLIVLGTIALIPLAFCLGILRQVLKHKHRGNLPFMGNR
jgi:hypothetical protein